MKTDERTVVGRAVETYAISDETTRRDALVRNLAGRLLLCNVDELEVLDEDLTRLELGRERYGFLDLSKERDWDVEEVEELIDARLYRLFGKIKKRREQLERLRCEAADEIAALDEEHSR